MTNNGVEYVLSLKDLFTSKIRGATSATEKLNGAVSKTQGLFSGLSSKLAGLGLTVGVGALAYELLNVGKSFEQAEVGMKTMLGSATAAHDVFTQLQKDATTSPFQFEDLLKGNRLLISTGINAKAARDDFQALSNAVAATGGSSDELNRMSFNLAQIKNQGQAIGADIRQFATANINIYSVLNAYAKKYNLTLDKEKITYEQITAALKSAQEEGGIYYKGLENLANTTSGRLSNLWDAFKNTLYDVFVALSPVINSLIVGVTKGFGMVKTAISWVQNNFVKLKYAFQPVIDTLIYFWDTLKGVAGSFNWTATLETALGAIGTVLRVLQPLAEILIDGFAILLTTVIAVTNAILEMVNAVGQLFGMAKIDLIGGKQDNGGWSGGSGNMRDMQLRQDMLSSVGSGGMGSKGEGAKKSGTSLSAVESRGHQTFNIDITNLVNDLTISTTNLKESATAIKAEVTKALIGAVNDFQLMAVK